MTQVRRKSNPTLPAAVDPRIPAPGTILEHHDREGKVVATAVVKEDRRIRYRGRDYDSPSGAANAAHQARGGRGRVSGYVFFGLDGEAGRGRRTPLPPARTPVEAALRILDAQATDRPTDKEKRLFLLGLELGRHLRKA